MDHQRPWPPPAGRPADGRRASMGRRPARGLTVAPGGPLARRHRTTRSPSAAGAHGVERRPLAAPLRAVVLTGTGGTGVDRRHDDRAGDACRLDTAFRFTPRPARSPVGRRPGGAPRSTRRSPATSSRTWPPAHVLVFTPRGPLAPDTTYSCELEGLVDADGVAVRRPARRGRARPAAPAVVRLPAARRHGERRPRRGPVGAVHRARWTGARPKARPASTAAGKAVGRDGHAGRRGRHGPRVHARAAPLPYDAKVVDARRRDRRRSAAGAPLEADAERQDPPSGPKPRPAARSRGDPDSGGGGGARRRRHLGRGRDVLPAADELHPHRRLGDVVRGVLVSPGGRSVAPL